MPNPLLIVPRALQTAEGSRLRQVSLSTPGKADPDRRLPTIGRAGFGGTGGLDRRYRRQMSVHYFRQIHALPFYKQP